MKVIVAKKPPKPKNFTHLDPARAMRNQILGEVWKNPRLTATLYMTFPIAQAKNVDEIMSICRKTRDRLKADYEALDAIIRVIEEEGKEHDT